MTLQLSAELLMLLGGLIAFLYTVWQVRVRQLREKYGVGWIAVGFMLLLCGLFPQGVMTLAELCHLSYSSAVLFISLAAIYLFAFTVSVSLSGQYRRNVRLTQEVAMLEHRIRLLEQRLLSTANRLNPGTGTGNRTDA